MNDASDDSRTLVLTREIDAPRARIFEAWTTPSLLTRFFAPLPYTTPECRLDLRPGGAFETVMVGPDGVRHDNRGVFLEIVPDQKLVFTDAFEAGWKPSAKPFMVASIELEDLGNGRTRYIATARHWTQEDCEAHRQMGFHEGWGVVVDQLAALLRAA